MAYGVLAFGLCSRFFFTGFSGTFASYFVVEAEVAFDVFRMHGRVRLVDLMQHAEDAVHDDRRDNDAGAGAEVRYPVRRIEVDPGGVLRELVVQVADREVVHQERHCRIEERQGGFRRPLSPVLASVVQGFIIAGIDEAVVHVCHQRVRQVAEAIDCVVNRDDEVETRDQHPQGGAEDAFEVADHFPDFEEPCNCHVYFQRKGIEKITGIMKPIAKAAQTSPNESLPDIQTQKMRTNASPQRQPPANTASTLGIQG